jgi:hypothetical protein
MVLFTNLAYRLFSGGRRASEKETLMAMELASGERP